MLAIILFLFLPAEIAEAIFLGFLSSSLLRFIVPFLQVSLEAGNVVADPHVVSSAAL